jgi:pyruvate ferredoxin oxidoreductase beta subunit
MATYVQIDPTQELEAFKALKKLPLEEFFTSGHRTCQGCESALLMKMMAKAAGPRTIILGSTGCMYVANTTYYSTSWVVPWMHTQLGSSGAAALGTSAALKALMRKGKIKNEPINVIAFCGDGGGADMGLGGISATLTHPDYNLLILMYDNESYANTDIQLSGSTPWGAHTTFSPPGRMKRIMHHRWKKNMAGMMAAGHPTCRYEMGELAVNTGVWPLYEVENQVLKLTGKTQQIADRKIRRLPVRDYLLKQGRFAHFTKDDIDYFQSKVDEMWEKWLVPGVIPFFRSEAKLDADAPAAD